MKSLDTFPGFISSGTSVVQNLASQVIKPLKTSFIKLKKVILLPLFFCPQSGQNFS